MRIDEVESVARRHIDVLLAEQSRERGLLAIEIGHIADITSLLQKIGPAGHIRYPRLRKIGPIFQPVEELSEDEKREPRGLFNRLVHGSVHNDTIGSQPALPI